MGMFPAVFFCAAGLGQRRKTKENAAGQNPQRPHIDGVMLRSRQHRQYLQ
ncbi:hypothetical protein C7M22_01817 [Bacillus velezensis]|nr:hypothetical protein U471_03670 [Bacillus amyloliquefaciens CC178]MCP1565506.1 hypothetical protein [Bacillus velezensis]QEY89287.1 hypothetical protein BACIT_1360 [Bacillus amyloliquefaciens]QEY92133.1 hypothetical protein BACIH_0341 [Bacillus amyloliquefaciens]QHK07623.1 hypothetical protein C7M19_02632 [Bacillus velezensis]